MNITVMKSRGLVWLSVLCGTFLLFSGNTWAETKDWQKELKMDLVKVSRGKYSITEYQVCKQGTSSIQLKAYSEAPTRIISRDYFVAFTTLYDAELVRQLGDLECKDIKASIGSADVEISIVMTDEAIKMDLQDKRTNTKKAATVLWSDLFAKE